MGSGRFGPVTPELLTFGSTVVPVLHPRGPTLLILSPVPMSGAGNRVRLDRKLVEGVSKIAVDWPGKVICALRRGEAAAIAFGADYVPDQLGFALVDRDQICSDDLKQVSLVLAAADDYRDFDISREGGPPVAYVIENTASSRARMVWIEADGFVNRLRAVAWLVSTEGRRRRALRRALGVQVNGQPALDAYRPLLRSPHMFFDTRIKENQLPTEAVCNARAAYARSGQTLRLAFSGRLERIKGVNHLPLVARGLADRGVPFTLDIFGDGTLFASVAADIRRLGLKAQVRLHGAVDFDELLVPTFREGIDIFLCCHRQSDPSCTYLETLALGVPIVGYSNAAFRGVLALGPAGIATPMDRPEAMAVAVAGLNRDRERLVSMGRVAASLGRDHHFEAVMRRRVAHLRSLVAA